MKLLAINDVYLPPKCMQEGLACLASMGIEVEVRDWEHPTLVALQEANLEIENGGPQAVPLPAKLTANLDQFQILVVQFAPVSRQFMEAASQLQVIAVLRAGTENVDVEYATSRGITVMNNPGRNARAVAECAMGLILSEIRNLSRSHACLKQGDWRRTFPNSDAIPELCGKTVGLVGYGAVGRLMAGYLTAFGSRVIAFDPYCQGDPSPATLVDLDTLLAESDVVSLHARLTKDNHHLIGQRQLAQMKRSAILVNTARSGLVDEPALVRALSERRIQGAALDVFDVEPLPADHPLVKLDNVTITPHLAGSTIDAFRNSPRLIAGHLTRMLQGDEKLPIVNGVRPAMRIA